MARCALTASTYVIVIIFRFGLGYTFTKCGRARTWICKFFRLGYKKCITTTEFHPGYYCPPGSHNRASVCVRVCRCTVWAQFYAFCKSRRCQCILFYSFWFFLSAHRWRTYKYLLPPSVRAPVRQCEQRPFRIIYCTLFLYLFMWSAKASQIFVACVAIFICNSSIRSHYLDYCYCYGVWCVRWVNAAMPYQIQSRRMKRRTVVSRRRRRLPKMQNGWIN